MMLNRNVLSGVPQGSVLGPLLFLLYINDLPSRLQSECRLFADDALVFNTRNNQSVLQNDLGALEHWSHTWQLSFNPSKCSVLSVGEKDSKQSYYLNKVRLKNVNAHPYLGVELSCDLKWEKHITKIITKANRVQGMLNRVLKTADTKTRLVAYKSLLRPILEYASQVWDPYLKKEVKRLERIQNKALRFVYRVKGKVSFTELRQDTGMSSLKERRRNQRLKLFCKVLESGVIKQPYDIPVKAHNTRQSGTLYAPTIKTSALFNSFWPRTTRELRIGDNSK